MRRSARIGLAVALVAALAALLAARLLVSTSPGADLRLDEYADKITTGQVESAAVDSGAGVVTGRIRTDTGGYRYTVRIAPEYADEMTDKLLAAPNQVQVTASSAGPGLADTILAVLPYVLLAALVAWVVLRSSYGAGLVDRLRRRRSPQHRPDVTFKDVAGLDEAVRELREITDFLADPAKFAEIGARIPRGVLLYGPPGAGKTLLARAVAGEAGVPFLSLSGSDFVEMFAGVGAARVRDLFKDAKAAGAAIVFIDEIDAVGRARGAAGTGGSGDEREQTLNQLLVEMDGFFRSAAIVVMAATNRPDILDPALLRPGRFDRHVAVDLPDVNGRRRILELHAKKVPVTAAVDLDRIARRTAGFSGADLANVVNEAALLAAREGRKLVRPDDLSEATERVLAGPERSRVLSDAERLVTAVHEAGHAICGHVLPVPHRVDKVSIVGRGSALGFTMVLPEDDRMLLTRTEFLDELTVLLGGRAAEEVVLGEPTNGASDDLARATHKAREMVCRLGMSKKLGPRTFADQELDGAAAPLSAELAAEIDHEITATVAEAFAAARAIVADRRDILQAVVTQLLEVESLEGEDLEALLGSRTEFGVLARSDLWPTAPEGGDEHDHTIASG
ncbi:MAG: ATP-dependent zinc metalloprotease FtsH [Acidimicrobiia bacterium]